MLNFTSRMNRLERGLVDKLVINKWSSEFTDTMDEEKKEMMGNYLLFVIDKILCVTSIRGIKGTDGSDVDTGKGIVT